MRSLPAPVSPYSITLLPKPAKVSTCCSSCRIAVEPATSSASRAPPASAASSCGSSLPIWLRRSAPVKSSVRICAYSGGKRPGSDSRPGAATQITGMPCAASQSSVKRAAPITETLITAMQGLVRGSAGSASSAPARITSTPSGDRKRVTRSAISYLPSHT
ncbi:hypothetical protein D9M69_334380 [compost metagenome]